MSEDRKPAKEQHVHIDTFWVSIWQAVIIWKCFDISLCNSRVKVRITGLALCLRVKSAPVHAVGWRAGTQLCKRSLWLWWAARGPWPSNTASRQRRLSVLGCLRQSSGGRWSSPLLSTGEATPGHWDQCWVPSTRGTKTHLNKSSYWPCLGRGEG